MIPDEDVFKGHVLDVMFGVKSEEDETGFAFSEDADIFEPDAVDGSVLAVDGIERLVDDNEAQIGAKVRIRVGIVDLIVGILIDRGGDFGVELDADIGEEDVGDFSAVAVLNIHGDVRVSNYVGVFEADILHLGGGGFGADFHGAAPVAPDHVVAEEEVFGVEGGFSEPFNDEGVVVGAQEAILDDGVLRIAQIDTVGVVAPEPDKARVADRQTVAARARRRPDVGVALDDPVDRDIFAVDKAEEPVEFPAFEGRRVENTGPRDRHVLNVLPVNPPVDDGSRVDKDFVAAFDVDAPDVMDAGSEVSEIGGVEILGFFVDWSGEEV